jgi:NADPH:quinone reductase-like Zn-dependent oxidoreductase
MAKGTDVFGFLQYDPSQTQGAFAEYIIVKRQDSAAKPSGVSHQIAAASTTESITALQGMRDLGGLEKGQSILINGAAGGVGSAAVQISKVLGAHVTAVCGTRDTAQVKERGADVVLDRTKEPNYLETLLKEGHRFDVIFDVPNMICASGIGLLKPNGAIVNTVPTISMLWGKLKTLFSSKKVTFVGCHAEEADLKLIGKWLDRGDLTIPIDSTFKIDDIQAAMTKQAGRKKGRVLIQIENGW